MIARDLLKYLEDWAPPGAAWERDNVGLQIGSTGEKIQNILLCLELDDKVLTEALQKKCNFIFTHHPFLYTPIKRIDTDKDSQSKLIQKIIKNDIIVYSAHTNLDFTKGGVSFELARQLKLKNITFLENEEGNQFKVIVFVPEDRVDEVSNAMFAAGAGKIGEYEKCSYRSNGQGTFIGTSKSNPAVGTKENFETVNEIRFETIVESWKLNSVIKALITAHPYQEPAYDIYQLKNKNVNYGAGVIGELEADMDEKDFLDYLCKELKIKNYKYSNGKSKKVKKVAVCGGSGSDMLNIAISKHADAFITADIKYHTFHDALGKIILIDAGHYETEIFSLNAVEKKLKKFFEDELEDRIKVFKYSGSTNPVKFYKQ